jgi:hypothetical protein
MVVNRLLVIKFILPRYEERNFKQKKTKYFYMDTKETR